MMGFLVTFAEVLAAIGVLMLYVLDFNRSCITSGKNDVLCASKKSLNTTLQSAKDQRLPCWIQFSCKDDVGLQDPTVDASELHVLHGGKLPMNAVVQICEGTADVWLHHPSKSETISHRLKGVQEGDGVWVPRGWVMSMCHKED